MGLTSGQHTRSMKISQFMGSFGIKTQSKFHLALFQFSFYPLLHTRAYVTWNEKVVHVWSPFTLQLIYQVDFFTETKSHTITTLSYSHTNFVSFLSRLLLIHDYLFSYTF